MMRRIQDQLSPFLRCYLGLQAVITWASSFQNDESTLHEISSTADGGLFIWGIGICGALMLLDLFINDWTPDCIRIGRKLFPVHWANVWKNRHWLFVGIAACYAAQPQIADVSGQSWFVILICYFQAVAHMAAAFIDAGERSRRLWWQRTQTN
jgi:hypothetical protein